MTQGETNVTIASFDEQEDIAKHSVEQVSYLQQKLNYQWNGEKCFIPQFASFSKVVTMAGKGTEKPINDVERLRDVYHIPSSEWKKQAGKIISDQYIFDLHWYEANDGLQREVKLKYRKKRIK